MSRARADLRGTAAAATSGIVCRAEAAAWVLAPRQVAGRGYADHLAVLGRGQSYRLLVTVL
jgi:hypothetical protein